MQTNNEEFAEENAELAKLNARGRVAWALERFGEGLVMSTSFGLQCTVM